MDNIIAILSALLTPTIAIVAIVIQVLMYKLAAKKRKDDLFDKRFDFYQKVEKYWISTYQDEIPPPDIIDLIPFASKASLLFSEDISKHILAFEGKKSTNPFFADDDFSKPFYKYLKLK